MIAGPLTREKNGVYCMTVADIVNYDFLREVDGREREREREEAALGNRPWHGKFGQ